MKAEIFNLRDQKDFDFYYPTLCHWWGSWKFPPLSPNSLPRTGVIIKNEDQYICAGWLYFTDSDVAVIGWLISSKDKNKRLRIVEGKLQKNLIVSKIRKKMNIW